MAFRLSAIHFQMLLLVLLIIGAYAEYVKFSEIGFNYFDVPESDEIYLLETSPNSALVYSSSQRGCLLCGEELQLSGGESIVPLGACIKTANLSCEGLSLWFKKPVQGSEYFDGGAELGTSGQELIVSVSGEGKTSGYRRMLVYVDGEIAHSPSFELDGHVEATERVNLGFGNHSVRVEFLGKTLAEGQVEISRPYPSALLLSAVLSLILCAVLLKRSAAGALVGIGIIFSSLILHFQLGALGLWWALPLLLSCAIAYYRNKTIELPELNWKQGIIISLVFTAYILALNALVGNLDIWSSYYVRHADMTTGNWSPFYNDYLSYLGRQSTYPPAFFDLAASLAGLTGMADFTSFRVPFQMLLAFLFAFSTYAVFSRYSSRAAAMGTGIIMLQWFFTMTATTLPLHTLSYVLLALSVIAPIPLSFVFLGVSFATHPITIFIYPFYLYVSRKFELDLKSTVVVPMAAVLISIPFYSPIFLQSGLPYEIVPERWGYFFTYGINGMYFEFLMLLPLLPLCFLALLKRAYRLPAALLAFFAFLNAFVLYRVNVILTVLFAGLLPLAFENEFRDRKTLAILLLFFLLNVLLIPVIHSGTRDWCGWGVSNDMCISPMLYLSRHTSSGDSVVLNPMYGHLETYLGKRPVLADLYVEYANQEKFEAEDAFYYSGNLSAARHYNVSLAVEDQTVWPPRPGRRSLSPRDGDRMYDNGFMQITRIR